MRCSRFLVLIVPTLVVGACGGDDDFVGVPDGARAFVTSDPPGGRILVDGRPTSLVTPDTVEGLLGRHDLTVMLDTLGAIYRYSAQVMLSHPDSKIGRAHV